MKLAPDIDMDISAPMTATKLGKIRAVRMEKPNSENGWLMGWMVAALIAVLAVAGLAMIGGSSPEYPQTLGQVLFDYQTLITGILAVAAASATIWQMLRTDLNQQHRHNEALAVSQEGDRRRLERALHPQLADLKSVIEKLSTLDLSPDRYIEAKGDPYWHTLSDIGPAYKSAVEELLSILERQQFVDGEIMFDGRTTRMLSILLDTASRASGIVSTHVQTDEPRLPGWYEQYEAEFDGPCLLESLKALPLHLGNFSQELERLEPLAIPLLSRPTKLDRQPFPECRG